MLRNLFIATFAVFYTLLASAQDAFDRKAAWEIYYRVQTQDYQLRQSASTYEFPTTKNIEFLESPFSGAKLDLSFFKPMALLSLKATAKWMRQRDVEIVFIDPKKPDVSSNYALQEYNQDVSIDLQEKSLNYFLAIEKQMLRQNAGSNIPVGIMVTPEDRDFYSEPLSQKQTRPPLIISKLRGKQAKHTLIHEFLHTELVPQYKLFLDVDGLTPLSPTLISSKLKRFDAAASESIEAYFNWDKKQRRQSASSLPSPIDSEGEELFKEALSLNTLRYFYYLSSQYLRAIAEADALWVQFEYQAEFESLREDQVSDAIYWLQLAEDIRVAIESFESESIFKQVRHQKEFVSDTSLNNLIKLLELKKKARQTHQMLIQYITQPKFQDIYQIAKPRFDYLRKRARATP